MSTALMEPPTAKPPQHLGALATANRIRLGRAELHRLVTSGRVGIGEAMRSEYAQSEKIGRVLGWQHRWGPTRSRKFLSPLGITDSRKVRDLTDRQRDLIVSALLAKEHGEDLDELA